MEIDWGTFGAQIVNLFILMWILKKFLYRPLLNAIDAREAKIFKRVSDADNLAQKSREELARLDKDKAEAGRERYAMLEKTRQDAEALKTRLEKEARAEVEKLRQAWSRELELEKAAFFEGLREMVAKSFTVFAEKSLKDLADTGLERRLIEVFKVRLDAVSSADFAQFKASAEKSGEAWIISGCGLASESERELTLFVGERFNFGGKVNIGVKVDPDLICGIELMAKEKSLSLSMKENFATFVETLKKTLAYEEK